MGGGITEAEVNELTDLFQAFQMLQKYGITPKGVATLDDAKCRLLQYLRENFGEGNYHTNAADVMKEVLEKDISNRENLAEIYSLSQEYVGILPSTRRQELDTNIPHFERSLKTNYEHIKRSECAILVAGEVSSGKSSLLNLLLGIDLLPTSLLSCTSVICELKHSQQKYAVAHYWDESRHPDWVDLGGESPKDILARYVHQKGERSERFQFKRVEVFWPFPLLQGGIYIVDSPGIGESREMTEMVKSYLPSAFAFIYVINSANAGGLQPDRLQDLLSELSRRHDELSVFDPRSAIFVCNKWDLVPVNEAKAVLGDTLQKLQRCWPGLQESQIFRMSTVKAMNSLTKSGFVTSEFGDLLKGIESLLPISLQCKLENYYRWLSNLLRRSSFYLRVYIANETRSDEDRKELTEYLHNQLDRLETENKTVATELRMELHRKSNAACDQLIAHLASASTRGRLMHWEETECPDGDDWDILQEVLVAKVNKRIRREVNDWDTKNCIFTDIQVDLIQKFQSEFELMEDQLSIVEGDMMGRGARPMDHMAMMREKLLQEQTKPLLTTGQKVALGAALPILIPLGVVAGMFLLPVAGVKAIRAKLEDRKLLKEYRQNKSETLSIITDEVLENFLDRNNLTKLIQDQLQVVTQNVDCMIKSIPNLIEADRMMINRLQEEREAMETSLVVKYLPMYQKCQELEGKLDYFYAAKVRQYDIAYSDLDIDLSAPPVGSGVYGDVYAGKWKTAGGRVDIAVKVRREVIDEFSISDMLLEEGNLRKFRHENIVTYYGTAVRRNRDNTALQYLMIMEFCETTLRSRITGAFCPGKVGPNHAFWKKSIRDVAGYAAQIAKGLIYLHERSLVHRDLKPQNILLTKDDVIKLADVGLTKSERDISGTMCGTSGYAAPEVLAGNSYGKAADIYSFSIIVWEMWYGRMIHDEMESLHQDVDVAIRSGARPCLVTQHEMPERWKDIIRQGWANHARLRPSAEECRDFFYSYKQNQNMNLNFDD